MLVNKCVPAMVAAQAAATPSRTAIVMREEVLTYAELEARSNQLARYLRSSRSGAKYLSRALPSALDSAGCGRVGCFEGRRSVRSFPSGISRRSSFLHAERCSTCPAADPTMGSIYEFPPASGERST